MPKQNNQAELGQQGAVFIFFIIFFVAVLATGVFVVFKTVTNTAKKINQSAEVLSVTLETEYNNPFDKKTQYVNPFAKNKNPFDELE